MPPPLLVDLSHHNAVPDWAALKAGGVVAVIAKASEGTSFADPSFAALRAGAHAAGLAFGAYHFSRLRDPAAEAAWFAHCVGRLQQGEFAALDLEVSAPGVDPVAWTGRWLTALASLGVPVRLLYLNKTELAACDWTPIVARGVLLWLADYDGSPDAPAPHGPWPVVAVKQWTDHGSVPGAPGQVDVDALLVPLAQLTGAAPAPDPEDDTVKFACYLNDPAQKDGNGTPGDGAVAIAAPGFWWHVPSPAYLTLLQARGVCGTPVSVPPNEFAFFQSLYLLPEQNDDQLAAAVAGVKDAAATAATPTQAAAGGLTEQQVYDAAKAAVIEVLTAGVGKQTGTAAP